MEVTDRKRWINTILDILKFYIDICEENNLTYFIAYGSAIGAARHHGFIPWDDDVDVVMPRPDYDRFIQICHQRDMGRFEIVTPQNTPGYYLPFTKLCDRTTTLLEKRHYHCVFGMYIDIFVIDGMKNDPHEIEATGRMYDKYSRMLDLSNSYYSLSELLHLYICKKRIRIVFQYLKYALNRKKYSMIAAKEIEKLVRRYDYEQCEYTVKYPRGYGNREVYPKAWLEGRTMMPFETLQVALPGDYKRWLNQFFGDYTQLPPENQRHFEHSILYYNLDKRETLDVVQRKIKENI